MGTAVLSQSAARADDWPQRAVRIITPFPVGTGGDVAARAFAEKLTLRWGKPAVVDNRPGADGIIAVSALLNARDEHTLLFTNGGPFSSNPFSHDKLPYDAASDVVPVAPGAEAVVGLAVPASLNVGSLDAFVKLAASQPGKFNWGATPGALDYIVPGFLKSTGVSMTHVAYREIAPALQDLAQSRIQLYASAVATQLPVVQSGKVRVIAITNRERSSLVPNVPTAAEAGFKSLQFEAFLGFFGPRGMSTEVRNRISDDVRAVGADPAISARLAGIGLTVRTGTPDDLSGLVERERAQVAEFARSAQGAKP
jgi:tripartite-type tricarboxylate transporter receptor subunit TctC